MTAAHETEQARERAVAEQRRALERLEELVRWRKDFIASVIHDLLTPVASIAGFAELLLEGELSDAERRDFLERILSNVQAQQALLDDLVAYAQLESGRLVLVPERLDLTRLVHNLIANMAPVVGDRHLGVATAGVELTADRLALERILRNLLVNAAQHTGEGAAIRVRAREDDDAVVIEVEDEGSGIPAERLPHVFEPFERGKAGGSGLGLWIVKHHVDLHGGEVSADSEVGKGTVFRLTLPRTPPAADTQAGAVTRSRSTRRRRRP
ncbi:MAG: sensor histidine kinase [Nitriliruptorales bacterium]